MAGYSDTKKLIEDTLVGRPEGSLIYPYQHQRFALSMLDYIHSVELMGVSDLQGIATTDTVPVEPENAKVAYIATVPPSQTYVYTNFLDEDGDPITITTGANTVSLLTLLWNGTYWQVQNSPVQLAVDYSDGFLLKDVISTDVNPGTPDLNMFYIALPGTYTHFTVAPITVKQGQLGIFTYENSAWSSEVFTIANWSVVNVNDINGSAAAYGSAQAARAAVPLQYRKCGLQITYLLSTGWMTDQYIGPDESASTPTPWPNWGTSSNWQVLGPVTASQNTETGGLDLNIGNETTNVASQNSITDIEGGNEFLTPEFQNGGMYLNDGTLYEISSGKYSDAINTEGCERMFITGSLNSSFSGFTLLYKADGIIKLAMPEEWIAQGLYPTGVDMTDVAYVKFSFYKDSTPIIKIVKVGEIPQIKSDIEKIDADIADIKPKIDGGDNFTFPTFQSGKMYLSDGSLYETSSGKYSGAINTANCERLFITGTLDNSFSACTLLYKADNTIKQYLEESAIAQGIFSDGVDMTDVAYIKFSFKNTSSPIIKLVRNGIENDIVEIKEEISEIQDDIMELQSNSINLYRKNLLNPSTCIADKYISAADGVMRDLEGTYATDFIEIKENTPYTFSVERNPTTTAISQWAYYNSQKQYISGELNPSLFERITRTTPANAKYVRMTVFLPNISMLQEGKIKTQFRPYTDRIVPDNNLDIEEKICTVHPTSNAADFNSILQALKETPDDYTILLKKGEYDMKAEYKSYYGADFFDNYDGYDLHTDDEFYRGYWLARGRKIIGESNAVIKFIYTGTNTIVNRDFSILNTAGNNVIDNITLKLDGCGRYHIHDDWQNATGTQPAKIEYKNLIFIGRSSTAIAVGAGLGLKCVYFFDNCIFTAENTYDISYHGSTADSTDICDKIFVRNCKGLGTLAFRWYGLSTSVTDCFVSACKFHSIVCEAASSGQTNENMRLTQWCNEVDE